jgi:hypothetical protein
MDSFAPTDRSHDVEQSSQRDMLAAQNITLPDLPALHGEAQTHSDIAYVDQIQDEFKVDLHTPASEMLQHEGRRREISVVRPDRHGRIGDHHGKS